MCRAKGVSLFLDCGGCRCVNTDDSAFVYSILLIIRIKNTWVGLTKSLWNFSTHDIKYWQRMHPAFGGSIYIPCHKLP